VERFTGFIIRAPGELASAQLRPVIHAIVGHWEDEFGDDATIILPGWRPSRFMALCDRRSRDAAAARRAGPAVMGRPWGAVRGMALRGTELVWHDLRFKDLYRSGKRFELMQRALGFAALAILTLIPLLVLVAAANPNPHRGLAVWVVYGMDLTGSSANAVTRLFSAPARVLGTTSVFSALLLGVAGVSFAGSVQAGFERIWGLPAGPWHKIWRQAVWLAALIACFYATAAVGTVTNGGLAETAGRVAVAVVLGIAFFWWGLRFLVNGRVSYLAALPGAVATIVCLAGLRVFSGLVFEPLIVTNAVTYGALGTVLIVQSWLIGVGWCAYGGQLFGRWFHDAWLQAWAHSRSDHGEAGGGKASEQDRHTL
jgi:membrane protein